MKLKYDKKTKQLTVDICCNRDLKINYNHETGIAGIYRADECLREDMLGTRITVSDFLNHCETICKIFNV